MTTKPTIVVQEAKRPLPLKEKNKSLYKERFGIIKNAVKTGFVTRWVHQEIFENKNEVTLVVESVSEIIYKKNVQDVSVTITDLLQGQVK